MDLQPATDKDEASRRRQPKTAIYYVKYLPKILARLGSSSSDLARETRIGTGTISALSGRRPITDRKRNAVHDGLDRLSRRHDSGLGIEDFIERYVPHDDVFLLNDEQLLDLARIAGVDVDAFLKNRLRPQEAIHYPDLFLNRKDVFQSATVRVDGYFEFLAEQGLDEAGLLLFPFEFSAEQLVAIKSGAHFTPYLETKFLRYLPMDKKSEGERRFRHELPQAVLDIVNESKI